LRAFFYGYGGFPPCDILLPLHPSSATVTVTVIGFPAVNTGRTLRNLVQCNDQS
jgi:hypothetical protein